MQLLADFRCTEGARNGQSRIGYPARNRLLLGYQGHFDMLTLDPSRLVDLPIPIGTGWLLGACMEARGDHPERRIVESNRGRYGRGESVAPSGDWQSQAT